VNYAFHFNVVLDHLPELLDGAWLTIRLSAMAMAIGLALAVLCAYGKTAGPRPVRWLISAYVELIRNTPFIVQMFFVYFGLPSLGLRLSAMAAAVLAMIINLTAYAIEIVRAGIEAVPVGQREAARAFGLRPSLVFGLVVLPQALGNVYPALVSQIVITMLESAVVSQIAVVDLTHVADFVQSRNFRAFETYLVITAVYLILAVLLRRLLARGGRRLLAGRAA
jgi:polar amino acid transport system permease protein